MFDCDEFISLEECLKRKLKANSKISQQANSVVQSTPPSTPVIQNTASSSKHTSMPVMKSKAASAPVKAISTGTHAPDIKIKPDNHKTSTGSSSGGGGSGGGGSIGGGGSGGSYRTNDFGKGGVVINNQSMLIKTNFEMAGRLKPDGSRPDAKAVGSHARASVEYMDNHGSRDLDNQEELSNTYNENGERMSRDEFNEFKKELNSDISAFRRTVIDPGQKEFDRDDMNRLVRESMQELKERSGKDFDFKYAIHTDTQQIHAHVLSYGSNSDINLTKEQLQQFKEIVGEKSHELLQEKELDRDRDLSLKQQLDIKFDGKLDDQDRSKENDLVLKPGLSL
jgi:hypothetical protein